MGAGCVCGGLGCILTQIGCVIFNLERFENRIQTLIAVPYHFQIKKKILRIRAIGRKLYFDSSFPKARCSHPEIDTKWMKSESSGREVPHPSGPPRRGAEGSASRRDRGCFG